MVNHESRLSLEWRKPVSVFFFGDLQSGVDGFSEEAWEKFKSEFKSTPNSWAIGLGDYGDWLRPTMRARLYGALQQEGEKPREPSGISMGYFLCKDRRRSSLKAFAYEFECESLAERDARCFHVA